MCHRGRAQRPLSFTTDAQNGTMGEEGVYTHSSAAVGHEEAPI